LTPTGATCCANALAIAEIFAADDGIQPRKWSPLFPGDFMFRKPALMDICSATKTDEFPEWSGNLSDGIELAWAQGWLSDPQSLGRWFHDTGRRPALHSIDPMAPGPRLETRKDGTPISTMAGWRRLGQFDDHEDIEVRGDIHPHSEDGCQNGYNRTRVLTAKLSRNLLATDSDRSSLYEPALIENPASHCRRASSVPRSALVELADTEGD
jgi:hypothetical protein